MGKYIYYIVPIYLKHKNWEIAREYFRVYCVLICTLVPTSNRLSNNYKLPMYINLRSTILQNMMYLQHAWEFEIYIIQLFDIEWKLKLKNVQY